jgi:hypothetical protein
MELLGGGLQKIRDHRDALRLPGRIPARRQVAGRPRRAAVDRRLVEHVVVEPDQFAVATFGKPRPALFGDRLPVGVGLFLVGAAGADVALDLRPMARGRHQHHRRIGHLRASWASDIGPMPSRAAANSQVEERRIEGCRILRLSDRFSPPVAEWIARFRFSMTSLARSTKDRSPPPLQVC